MPAQSLAVQFDDMNAPMPIAAALQEKAQILPPFLTSPGCARLEIPSPPSQDFQTREALIVAYLDKQGQITQILTIDEGERDRINLSVRAIIQEAFNSDCNRFLLFHNHPSGDPQPSAADIRATRLLCRTTAALDLELLDHLIIAPHACFSFRAAGLL